MDDGRIQGEIVHMARDKGYGFIVGTDNVRRFFHRADLRGSHRFESLQLGTRVTFLHVKGPKGPRAEQVQVGA